MKVVVRGSSGGSWTFSLNSGLATIGRGGDCDLILQEPRASRRHAELRRYGDQWLIVDLDSTNGTLVGGVRLQPQVARPVSAGTTVVVGDTRLWLEEEPGAVAPDESPVAKASPVWAAAVWGARVLVVAGCMLIVAGSLSEWIEIRVRLPIVPIGMNRSFGGMDSGYAWLFVGLAVVALLLMLMDVASRRWGLAAGLSQSLVASAVVLSVAVQVRQYYQAATQRFLGISLVDVLAQYARDLVDITFLAGLYMLAAGLAALVVGGLLRVVVAGLEPPE